MVQIKKQKKNEIINWKSDQKKGKTCRKVYFSFEFFFLSIFL